MDEILNLLNNNQFDKLFKISNILEIKLEENNILHLLAIRGNEKGLDYFIKQNIDITIGNLYGSNIIHLLFKNGFDELAEKYYKQFPELLNKFDNDLILPIFYCIDRFDVFNKCLKTMKDNKFDIYTLINTVSTFSENIITRLIDLSDDKQYLDYIKHNIDMINFNLPAKNPILIYSIFNNKTNCAKLFINHKKGIDIKNDNYFLLPLNVACGKNNLEIVKLLLKNDDNLTYGGVENDYLPINIAINNHLFDLLELLMDYIKDYMTIDKYKNTYAHYIADRLIYLFKNKFFDLERKLRKSALIFIEKSDIDYENNTKITARQLISEYIKIKEKNKDNDISDVKKIIKRKEIKDKSESDEEFKLIKSNKHFFTGLFGSAILHKIIYILYLLQKYKDLAIPSIKYSEKKREQLIYEINMQNINYCKAYSIIGLLYYDTLKYLYPILPSNILWANKDLNYINPDVFDIIKDLNQRFILLTISLIGKKYNHANCIVIDKKNKTIRRFEPYGIDNIIDEKELDDYILTNIEKITQHKYRYYKPSEFLEKIKFQLISNDNLDEYRKVGDPAGYCLAWCIWYVELKLNNPDMEEIEMINQASDKILKYYKKYENPYLYFIRDYARKLNDEKDKILKKMKINKNDIYDVNFKYKNAKKISEYLNNYF
jgi:hypothetical protein